MQSKSNKFHYLLHSVHLIEERLRIRIAPLGIRPRQARILDALARMGRASQAELAREFALTPASMSTMTSRLLAAGLIEKHVDEQELRSNVLELSVHGRSLLEEIYREWQKIDQEICAVIGVDNAELLATITYELRNGFNGSTPGGEVE
jgi:DNA-binding MarR family transcriptional regulator